MEIWYWAFGMPPIGGSQLRILEIWSKVMHLTYLFPFEKQLQVFYWDLVETQHLAMAHQVTAQSEFPITNSMLPHPTSYLGKHPFIK